jgi:iron complex transport system permease protein
MSTTETRLAIEREPRSLNATIHRRSLIWTLGLAGILIISATACIGIGPVSVSPPAVVSIIAHHLGMPGELAATEAQDAIVWDLRVPRVILGVAVGAGLAICGVALQAMVRNVLADPYILGISSGASTGAAAAILFGLAAGLGEYSLPVSAFIGAVGASFLVFTLARGHGSITSMRLLLSGLAIGYALSAATSFLIFASNDAEGSRSVMFWMLGSLSLARWAIPLTIVTAVVILTVAALLISSPQLDAISAGDETAIALGIRPDRTRIGILIIVSLCTGVIVAASGAIGFVGLIVPHLARRITGAAHRRLIPITALLGANLLIWADAAGRIAMQPRELPIGILTALVGAPFLAILIRSMGNRH